MIHTPSGIGDAQTTAFLQRRTMARINDIRIVAIVRPWHTSNRHAPHQSTGQFGIPNYHGLVPAIAEVKPDVTVYT
jgi:hypothetical protein